MREIKKKAAVKKSLKPVVVAAKKKVVKSGAKAKMKSAAKEKGGAGDNFEYTVGPLIVPEILARYGIAREVVQVAGGGLSGAVARYKAHHSCAPGCGGGLTLFKRHGRDVVDQSLVGSVLVLVAGGVASLEMDPDFFGPGGESPERVSERAELFERAQDALFCYSRNGYISKFGLSWQHWHDVRRVVRVGQGEEKEIVENGRKGRISVSKSGRSAAIDF